MYEYFSTINIHDHFRKGSLQFEQHMHRLVSSILENVIDYSCLSCIHRHELRQKDVIENHIDDFLAILLLLRKLYNSMGNLKIMLLLFR